MATEEALNATQQAVSDVARTAERARRAAEAAAQEASSAAGRPQIKAATGGEFFSYKYDGPPPTTFQEAPMLAELVQQGQLPPLMERLPVEDDIRVVNVSEIGEYGGTYRITSNGLGGHEANLEQWVQARRRRNRVVRLCRLLHAQPRRTHLHHASSRRVEVVGRRADDHGRRAVRVGGGQLQQGVEPWPESDVQGPGHRQRSGVQYHRRPALHAHVRFAQLRPDDQPGRPARALLRRVLVRCRPLHEASSTQITPMPPIWPRRSRTRARRIGRACSAARPTCTPTPSTRRSLRSS